MLKSKTILTLSALTAVLSLTACQPKDKAPEQAVTETAASEAETALTLVGENEPLAFDMPKCDEKNCPEVNIERLRTNQAFIDDLIDRKILESLSQVIDASPTDHTHDETSNPVVTSKQQVSNQTLEQQAQPYITRFLALDQELKALSSNHHINVMIEPKILNAQQPLATVVLNTSSYLGGAHGSSAQDYYNFDLKKQTLVSLDDLLLPNQKTALNRLAHDAFRTWVIDSKLANNVAEYEQGWKFSLSDNYYLGTDGLILQYSEYEIGPYVVGLPRLTLPYAQLQNILKPEYLPKAQASASPSS